MRAVGGEPGEQASIEVLNFPLGGGGESARGGDEEEAGGDRAGGRASGGCSRGYGDDFDESRSAVVFRNWFTAEQQQVCVGVCCVNFCVVGGSEEKVKCTIWMGDLSCCTCAVREE